MPRKRPGALRARQTPRVAWSRPPERIHGLSARTTLAIDRVERSSHDYYIYPGVTRRALHRYRAFLRPSGRRPLYPQDEECSCRGCALDDVRHARDVLEEILRQLPGRPRGEVARRVRALDTEYLQRTLPDPFAAQRQWDSDLWWRRRLGGGRGVG